MRLFLSAALLLGLLAVTAGCQAFLEDYSYQPLGNTSSSSSY